MASSTKWIKAAYISFTLVIVGIVAGVSYVYLLPPPQIQGNNLAIGEVQKIDTNTPLRISFSRWMDQKSVEQALHISPARPGEISWEGNTLVFRPEGDSWGMQKEYQVWIDNTAQDILRKKLPESFYQRFAISGPPHVVMNLPLATVVDEKTPITMVFDRAMIPATTLAITKNFDAPVTISPRVSGKFKWLGTNTLQFLPERLLPATTYTVQVDKSMQDIYGLALKENFSWQFDTSHPDIVYSYPTPNYEKAGPSTEVIIRFNQAIDQGSLEQNIEWETADTNQKVSFALRLEEDGTKAILTPQQPLAYKTKFVTTVHKGLKSKEGQFTLDTDFVLPFTTVGLPIVVTSQPAEGTKDAPRYGVQIDFSNPMSSEDIDKFIKIEPRIENQFNDLNENLEQQMLTINGDFLPSTNYTVTLSKDWKDKYGQKMPYDFVLKFDTARVVPDLAFIGRKQFGLIDGYNTQYQQVLQAINVSQIKISLEKVDVNQIWSFLTTGKTSTTASLGTWSIMSPNPLNEVVEIPVDLSQKVQNSGLYVMHANTTETDTNLRQAFIVSKTALSLKAFPSGGLVWATDLKSGQPVENMKISLLQGPNKTLLHGTTDHDGFFSFSWPAGFTMSENDYYSLPTVLVVGEKEGDMAIVSNEYSWNQGIEPWNYHISQSYAPEKIRSYLTTDRPLYQPGQEIFLKGIYREDFDTSYKVLNAGIKVKATITNAQGDSIWEKDLQTDSHGSVSDTFTLPTSAPVGRYVLNTIIDNQYFGTEFMVQEYKKPLFQIDLKTNKDEYIRDEEIGVDVSASYYFGAPLAHANLTYRVYSDDYFFDRAPGYFSFSDFSSECFYCEPSGTTGKLWTEKTITTDNQGNARFTIPATFDDEKESQLLSIEVGVEDPNTHEMIYMTKEVVVHKAEFYIGVANQNYVVKQKENATFLIQSANINGKPRGNINGEAQLFKREYKTIKKRGVDGFFYYDTSFNDTLVKTTSFATNHEGKGQIVFTIPEGGQHHVVLRSSDSKGHGMTAATDIWASSENYINWGRDNNDMMEIIPDKDEYTIGDTAKLLVKSPYEGVKAMLTIERNGILERKIIDIPTTATVIEVPLKPEYLPNVFVSVLAVKGYGKDNAPGFKLGYINLRLDNLPRKLTISLIPDKTSYEPGNVVSVDMEVKDADGKPITGDFAVAVVDQGLLALSGNRDDDLLERFFGQRSLAVNTYESLVNLIQRIDVKKGGGAKGGSGSDALAKRKNFKDTAYFNPHILTNDQGKATVKFTLPDNITTWQIWAFGASDNTNVGSATVQVLARKNVFVEPIMPKFLTAQDKVRIGAVVHNLGSQPMNASLTLSADHVQVDNASQNMQIAAQGSQTIYWNTIANTSANRAVFNFALKSGDTARDSLDRILPIVPWVSKETSAFGGTVQGVSAIEQLVIPVGTLPETVNVKVNITTDLQDTTKAFYQGINSSIYDSADIIAAKLLAVTISPQVIPSKDKEKLIGEFLQQLYTCAQNDGGFSYFPGNSDSDPFLSGAVLFALSEVTRSGTQVDDWIYSRLHEYLLNYFTQTSTTLTEEEQSKFTNEGLKEAESRIKYTLNTKAYIAYVLTQTGDTSISTQSLVERYQEMSLIGQGYLALSLQNLNRSEQATTVINQLKDKVIKTANLVHFEDSEVFWDNAGRLHMNVVLLNMLMNQGNSGDAQIINDLLRYIVIARESQVFSDAYADSAYIWAIHQWRSRQPQSSVSNWTLLLNEKEIATGNKNQEIDISTDLLKDSLATNTLVIRKSGDGALYYWGNMTYSRRGEEAEPMTEGLGIYREYFDLEDKEFTNPLRTFNRNQDVLVKLTVIVPHDQHNAIVEDNLPAGLSAQNFVFETTSSWQERLLDEISNLHIERSTVNSELGPLNWDHQEIRDDRVITYARYLPKGVYTVSYLAKAGIQGTYKTRPARVFLQRAPDVFGSTAVDTLEVK